MEQPRARVLPALQCTAVLYGFAGPVSRRIALLLRADQSNFDKVLQNRGRSLLVDFASVTAILDLGRSPVPPVLSCTLGSSPVEHVEWVEIPSERWRS